MAIRHLNIIPECFTELALLSFLGYEKTTKANGSSKVLVKLRDSPYSKAMGMIDEDKKAAKPSFFQEFYKNDSDAELLLLKHEERERYLIVVRPVMERWLISLGEKAGINIEEYGLPNDPQKLKAYIGTKQLKEIPGLLDWLKAVSDVESKPFRQIREWLRLAAPPDFERF